MPKEEPDYEKLKNLHQAEQASQFLGDYYPQLWRKVYLNSMKEGFTEVQSFEMLKIFIHGTAGGVFKT